MEKLAPQVAALYLGQQFSILGYKNMTLFSINGFGKCELGYAKDEEVFNVRYIAQLDEIKPILRPLSSLTEAEARELYKEKFGFEYDRESCLDEYWMGLASGYDSMLQYAIGEPNVWLKLLSLGIDLFGLIESGAAIDATKIEIEKNDG